MFPAIILAGGKSKRMGQRKIILKIENKPLIIHVLEALKKGGCNSFLIQIKSKKDQEILTPLVSNYNVRWSFDNSEKSDVLEALHIALTAAKKLDWEFVQLAPIDTPFVSPRLFQEVAKLVNEKLEAIIPASDSSKNTPSKGLEPLLSCIKTNSVIKQIETVVKKKDRRLAKVFENLNHKIVEPEEWKKWGVLEKSFKNLNYPIDLE
tara:strand:+ start:360 stop:980 length:621 start_codon:yes stop_codon:yes gene_type:complete